MSEGKKGRTQNSELRMFIDKANDPFQGGKNNNKHPEIQQFNKEIVTIHGSMIF